MGKLHLWAPGCQSHWDPCRHTLELLHRGQDNCHFLGQDSTGHHITPFVSRLHFMFCSSARLLLTFGHNSLSFCVSAFKCHVHWNTTSQTFAVIIPPNMSMIPKSSWYRVQSYKTSKDDPSIFWGFLILMSQTRAGWWWALGYCLKWPQLPLQMSRK